MGVDLAWFSAPWRRRDLYVDGAPRDDADVLWLQAGPWYADLRIPHDDHGGPVEAFAGTASWTEPRFTWHHDLDWIGSFPDDVGHLEVDGEDLIERGTFVVDGRDAPYEERWVRSGPAGPALVATAPGAMLVRVGDHAIVQVAGDGTFAAQRHERSDGVWATVFDRSAGGPDAGDQGVAVPDFDGAWVPGDELALGPLALTVVLAEAGGAR